MWFADWGAGEVIAVDLAGNREAIARVPAFPFSIDWFPDGRLLIVSSGLQRMEADGELVDHGDLTHLAAAWNELVVDGRGNAYVNQTGFDLMAGAEPTTGTIALVTPDRGSVRLTCLDRVRHQRATTRRMNPGQRAHSPVTTFGSWAQDLPVRRRHARLPA